MDRREALKLAAGAGLVGAMKTLAAAPGSIPIIDCHIHLFDTRRPGGVPWPEKSDAAIYRPALPDRYARLAWPLGVRGAIAVEASPLESDNDWVLRAAANHPIIVGFVGDLAPGTASYARDLDRLRNNPLFLGIRYGNLWARDLGRDSQKPGFMEDLRRLAADGLELDCANPDAPLIRAILAVADKLPELRIVIDHLPNATLPPDANGRKEYWANLRRLGQNPRVFVKLSEIPEKQDGGVPTAVSFYRRKLDPLWEIFGEDRVLYGSDWPNSDHIAGYAQTLGIVRGYVMEKGHATAEKFFWKNSIAAYHWRRRATDQPAL